MATNDPPQKIDIGGAGVQKTTFAVGLILAILASSVLSTAITTQLMEVQGPKGEKGDIGPQGLQGIQGPQGNQGEPGLGVEPGFLIAPAYDSGWVPANTNTITLNHDLGTTEVFVYLIWYDNLTWTDFGIRNAELTQWRNLTPSQITIFGFPIYATDTYLRVKIWKISEPTT